MSKSSASAAKNEPVTAWTEQGRRFEKLFRSIQSQTGRLVPPRRALTLSAVRAVAPYFRLLEIRPPDTALVRILGTAIVNRTRIESTGKNLLDSFSRDIREESWRHFEHLLAVPCGAVLHFEEEYAHNVVIELVSFPLADSHGAARFIASTVAEIDREDLDLRGEAAMQGRELLAEEFIDIGAGIGSIR